MTKEQKKLAELNSIRSWCMTVIEYAIKVDSSSSPVMNQFKSIVDSTFEMKNLKGLKTLKSDLRELFGDLSVSQREELSNLLALESTDSVTDLSQKAESILSKGSIGNEDDYRFLSNYIDYLLENNTTEKIESINKILLQYVRHLNKNHSDK
ncbi:hypothetical protein [Marinomonas balearica]|uniref:Uncharacterized protein n=1 Tax=Marinomonas balearica TaxID=491947 RepID=A0A4R6MIJ0_9GAMM|nr:hypothetical protein [Marinomonas balearica]TDP01236.1 hypothetical protein DFP79_0138 [Marinomonas balearica]